MSNTNTFECSVHVGNSVLGSQCHICAFFNNADEQHRALHSFIKEGLERGEKSLHIVNPDLRKDYIDRLSQDAVVERAIAVGQLDIVSWDEAYLRGDRFEQESMLGLVENVIQTNRAAGYPLTRFVGSMEWALLEKPGVDDLIEYETRVNYLFSRHYAPTICTYDLSKFSASVVMEILRTHPMAIVGGVLQENPFYVSPDQLLAELRERKSARQVH